MPVEDAQTNAGVDVDTILANETGQDYDPARKREYAWLRQHRYEHAGQYVALVGDKLVAFGTDFRIVYQDARTAGFSRPFMVRIEAADEPPFGGW